MKRVSTIVLALVLAVPAAARTNNSLSDDQLLQIKFDQKLNSRVSPDLIFRDETGNQVRLGDYFGRRPVVLILGYFRCPMLCTLVLNGAISSFQDLKWSVGEQFDVVAVSIDPAETTELAAEKKKSYVRSYGRGKPDGWHFLTGDTTAIQTLAAEVGFHFAYDPAIKQFAHPSGLVILTPDGKVARYFFGVTFSATELNTALREAGADKTGPTVDQFILLCFHYSPLTGKYGNAVMLLVRVGGVAMAVALAMFIFSQTRRKPEKPG